MNALSYRMIAKQCRIVAGHPATPPAVAALLITAAKLLVHQARRCILLASRLETLEAQLEK